MSLKKFINEIYLDPRIIKQKQQELFSRSKENPVRILTLKDFIKPELYEYYKHIIETTPYISCKRNDANGRRSQSVFVERDELEEFYRFFESSAFEKYLSLFFQKNIKRSFYISEKQIKKQMGSAKKGLIAEVYEQGEYLDWHVDKTDSKTVGNFIYYVSLQGKKMNEENGGYLELGTPITHDNVGGIYSNVKGYEKIFLQENTIVLMFVDDVSFHRIAKIHTQISRMTFNSSLICI